MTSQQSAARDAAKSGNINRVFSGNALLTPKYCQRDEITLESGDATNTFVDLVPINREASDFVAEESRVRISGSTVNALSVTFKLQKVDAITGAVTDLTATATASAAPGSSATAAQVVPLVPTQGGAPSRLNKGDRVRLVIVGVTSLGIGRVLMPELTFFDRCAPGSV